MSPTASVGCWYEISSIPILVMYKEEWLPWALHNQGSLVARAMSRSWIGSMLLGKALPSLSTKIPAGQEFFESDSSEFNSLEFGCIAGNRPLGMGMLLASVTKPHDGAVQLTETKFDQMTDYRVVPSNHMGLLFSRQVAEEVIQFLKAGCFLPETAQ